MKNILQFRNRRRGYSGWALMVKGATKPLHHTFCTTRKECRELRQGMQQDLYERLEVVKVKVGLEPVKP